MILTDVVRRYFPPNPSATALFGDAMKKWPVRAASFEDVGAVSPVPYLRYRTFINRSLEGLGVHIDVYDDVRSTEIVCLADIQGCTASREADPSFKAMVAHGALDDLIAKSDADGLADAMLTRAKRGISEADHPVTIIRHAWDGQMWISNIDGSHRTAALWEMDRRANRRRTIPDCEVMELTPSQDLKKIMDAHGIWLVSSEDVPAYMPYDEMAQAGISLKPLDRWWHHDGTGGTVYCISIPRSFEGFQFLADRMPPASSLSDMIDNAFTTRTTAPSATPAPL